jgi:hypothetical protein
MKDEVGRSAMKKGVSSNGVLAEERRRVLYAQCSSSQPSTSRGWPLMDRAAGGPPIMVLGFKKMTT